MESKKAYSTIQEIDARTVSIEIGMKSLEKAFISFPEALKTVPDSWTRGQLQQYYDILCYHIGNIISDIDELKENIEELHGMSIDRNE